MQLELLMGLLLQSDQGTNDDQDLLGRKTKFAEVFEATISTLMKSTAARDLADLMW